MDGRLKTGTLSISQLLVLAAWGVLAAGPTARASDLQFVSHAIELHERVLHPEDGLLIGNGDLSVSIYQDADHIIWRFGKGDVWDRRLDLVRTPSLRTSLGGAWHRG